MKLRLSIMLLVVFLGNSLPGTCQQKYPYQDSTLSVEKRVDDLLGRMTFEEKFWQMFMIPGDLSDGKERYNNGIFGFQVRAKGQKVGAATQLLRYDNTGTALVEARKINEVQDFFVNESRLGIPIIPFAEALHGLVRGGATSFPASIALAATWDTTLMADVALAVSRETKSRGIRMILSPVLNIARDVRWGRTEETYGEDPYLLTQMSLAFISQFETNGIITTPKHFVANVGDGGRDSYPIHFNERLLEEIYFPAYKAVFQKAGARSVMTSYNSLDGTPCTSNDWLLNKKLKEEWGFDGFVISDAGATGGANVLHYTSGNYAEATEDAVEGGLDVIFQTSYDHYPLFWEAFDKGMVDGKAVDESVRRVLKAKFDLGLFENPFIDLEDTKHWNGNKKHRELTTEAARKSMVLLKNENSFLPLSKNIAKVAVIGQDAKEARLGGYSGPGNIKVSILDGIVNEIGADKVIYAEGVERKPEEFIVIPNKYLFTLEDGIKVNGLKGEYFDNIKLEGQPKVIRTDKQVKFGWTLFSPHPDIKHGWYSVRWTGKIKSPVTAKVKIGVEGNDGYRLFINEELLIDNWQKKSFNTILEEYEFEKAKEYDIRLEFYQSVGDAKLGMIWDAEVDNKREKQIEEAVQAALKADVAVIVAGIEEGEFRDRAYLSLPGHQEELIQAVAKTGKPLAVVLVGGSAITMNNWLDDVNSVLMAWYPGENGGTAVADILFGNFNPAGRLPITFPVHESQLPLFYNHKPTGRGNDYNNLSGEPLFPFGYGLSYTNFEYTDLMFNKKEFNKEETVEVTCTIKNTGEYEGEEVIQLYIRDVLASVSRPVMELKDFTRINLKPGEEKKVSFQLEPENFEMLDKDLKKVIEPGDFRIMIGSSSKEIKLMDFITVI
jgi:beta-glucosidase